ncbi:MAG: hypothetical protein ACJAVS_002441 [Paracoccaceae bacterium]|jgi:hypothetical protein
MRRHVIAEDAMKLIALSGAAATFALGAPASAAHAIDCKWIAFSGGRAGDLDKMAGG